MALGVLAVHAVLVWGYTALFWGDFGRWHHEVERFAGGELPYRDFHWHYPPLSLWLVGLAARILGADIAPVYVVTSIIAAVLVVAFVRYSRLVVGRSDAWLVALCLVFAFAYVQRVGPPVPAGTYSPAALVGAACITIAVAGFARAWSSEVRDGTVLVAGLFAGLAVLSKQDFWFPATYLVLVHLVRQRQFAPGIVAAATVSLGAAVVVITAGVGILRPLAGGFNHARIAGGMGFPSWERITVDMLATAVVLGGFVVAAGIACRRQYILPFLACVSVALAAAFVHVRMSMSLAAVPPGPLATPSEIFMTPHIERGVPLLLPALGWLRVRVAASPVAVLLPPLLLVAVVWRWSHLNARRRGLIALLLGFAIILRSRRAFEGTEWFEFLLTLPLVLAAVELLFGFTNIELRRFRIAALAGLTVVAAHGYRVAGQGPGTVRAYPGAWVGRGTVHWPPEDLQDFQRVRAALDSLDPGHTRPVFAFGFSGGWNYFLERRNPYPFTQNFRFSAFDADSILSAPRPPGVFLIDNPFLDDQSFTSLDIRFDRWEQERVPAPYGTYDRPRFERMRRGCRVIPVMSSFPVYDCP